MSLALVVPSVGRPDALARCLVSATEQSAPFDVIVVAARTGDDATARVARAHGATLVCVDTPGVLAAMAAGVAATTSDLVAFTDDDATLPPGWATRVRAELAVPGVGGFGGRDVIYDDGSPRPTRLTARVGVVTWYGRVVGNHHCGTGPPRDVHVLKGVNSAYRRAALGLPTSLRGTGAQAHYEVSVGRYARTAGWRLVYDPAHTVRHEPAARLGEDQRLAPEVTAIADSAFNCVRGLARATQSRRLAYVILVGDGACPGIVRTLAAVVRGESSVRARRSPSWRGTVAAWRQRRTDERYVTFT